MPDWALLACALTTSMAWLLHRWLDPVNTVMLFLLTVALVAGRLGRSPAVLVTLAVFGVLESLFLASNLTWLRDGGWFPLLMRLALFTMLATWKRGSAMVAEQRRRIDTPMTDIARAHGHHLFRGALDHRRRARPKARPPTTACLATRWWSWARK